MGVPGITLGPGLSGDNSGLLNRGTLVSGLFDLIHLFP